MNKVTTTRKRTYDSSWRAEQARATRERIIGALRELFAKCESDEELTYGAVAQAAGVTEMTVYRHFPTRQELMTALWQRLNESIGPMVKIPETADELLSANPTLHRGFDPVAKEIEASITTRQGREMRAALNSERRRAFKRIALELNPRLTRPEAERAGAVLQLLHSAYAWDSMRAGWGFSGDQVADATQFALQALMKSIANRKEKS